MCNTTNGRSSTLCVYFTFSYKGNTQFRPVYITEMTDTRSILRYYIRSSLYSTYTYSYDISGDITTLYFKNSYVLYLLFFTVKGFFGQIDNKRISLHKENDTKQSLIVIQNCTKEI